MSHSNPEAPGTASKREAAPVHGAAAQGAAAQGAAAQGARADGGRDEAWTIQRLLAWTRDWLGKQGSASPRLDAELLLAHVLQCKRLDLLLRFDQPVTKDELTAYKALIRRRAQLEPVAYILGKRAFHAIELEVSPAVLVPRPETELLVDEVLAFLAKPEAPDGAVLDLCTGSGCIALAIGHALAERGAPRPLVASDASEPALQQARRNAERLGLEVQFCKGDLFDPLPSGARYAAVASNPPYVRSGDLAKLDRDVRDYEPKLALDGGVSGLDLIERIIVAAPRFLLPAGLLALEMGSRTQAEQALQWCGRAGLQGGRLVAVMGGPTHLVLAAAPAEPSVAAPAPT